MSTDQSKATDSASDSGTSGTTTQASTTPENSGVPESSGVPEDSGTVRATTPGGSSDPGNKPTGADNPTKPENPPAATNDKPGAAGTDNNPADATTAGKAPKPADASGPGTTGDKAADASTPTATGDKAADAGGPGGAAKGGEAGDKPADPFAAFAPAPELVPGRLRRIGRAVGRRLTHEWTLAALASLVLAVLMNWRALKYPFHDLPQDTWDPTLQAWQVAWSGHILLTNPAQLWQSNAFFPETWTFAFSDTLLGYAPAGMLGHGPEAAVLRYKILFLLAHALATFGAYVLVRQLGSGRIGAAVAGVGYTYAPWLLAQAGHLHILSNGGIPLALAMLARGHGWSLRHGYRPERRRAGWVYAGWLVAAWQLSLGFGIGLVFAYVLGLISVVVLLGWLLRRIRRRPRQPFGFRMVLADVLGGGAFAAAGVLLAIPYFKVADLYPEARRTAADLNSYSPPPSGFVTAPKESLIWGDLHETVRNGLHWAPEMTLLPGFVLYALAAAGLFLSIWTVRQRLLLLAGVLVSGILAMGTAFFGGTWTYLPLFEHLPGWDGLRTPGRLMLWTTLLLGILAAGSVGAFAERARLISATERVPPRPGPFLRLVTLLPLLLVLVEGLNQTPHEVVPPQPAAMRTANGPMLVLPSNQNNDQHVMLWSTSKFQDIVNGGSGFTPTRLAEVREATANFPDVASIDYLRQLGVRTVVVLRDRIAGTPLAASIDQPVDLLGIQREDVGNTVVYRL